MAGGRKAEEDKLDVITLANTPPSRVKQATSVAAVPIVSSTEIVVSALAPGPRRVPHPPASSSSRREAGTWTERAHAGASLHASPSRATTTSIPLGRPGQGV